MSEREAAIDFVCKARVFQRSNGGAQKYVESRNGEKEKSRLTDRE